VAILELSTLIHAQPGMVFEHWLDPAKHALIIGAPVRIEPYVGGRYELWDGSVSGEFVVLRRPGLIVKTWRTEDFERHEDDARTELTLAAHPQGTMFRVVQDQIPRRLRKQFRMAWKDVYFPALTKRVKGITAR